MTYDEWAHRVTPFRAVGYTLFGWGFLFAFSWRQGYPFAALSLYAGWSRSGWRVFQINRTPAR